MGSVLRPWEHDAFINPRLHRPRPAAADGPADQGIRDQRAMDSYRRPRQVDGMPLGRSPSSTTTSSGFRDRVKRVRFRRGTGNPFAQRDRPQTLASICAYWVKHI